MREPEATADDPAIPEQSLDLIRVRVRADVEVLRLTAQQQVPDAATDQIGREIVLVEPVEDPQRVRIDVPARERVALARNDYRDGHDAGL